MLQRATTGNFGISPTRTEPISPRFFFFVTVRTVQLSSVNIDQRSVVGSPSLSSFLVSSNWCLQIRAFCCVLVQVLGSSPLVISYMLTISGIAISDILLLYVRIAALVIKPLANPFFYVYFSSPFIVDMISL